MLGTLPLGSTRRALGKRVLLEQVVALGALACVAIVLERAWALGALYAVKVVAFAVVGGASIVVLAVKHLPGQTFGTANRVTLIRGGLVALLLGLIGDVAAAWLVVVLAGTALALDSVDGWLARRFASASDFGARFDMETDALLLLALSTLVWQYGKAGSWILLAGALRYGFVVLARFVPRFAAALPTSKRRQTAFVLTVVALNTSIAPIVTAPLSDGVAFAGLMMLGMSFAIDVGYLARDDVARAQRLES